MGKRLRSKAVKSSYSKALLISTILSDLKLKRATASPSCATLFIDQVAYRGGPPCQEQCQIWPSNSFKDMPFAPEWRLLGWTGALAGLQHLLQAEGHLDGADRLVIVSNNDKGRQPLICHRLAAITLLQCRQPLELITFSSLRTSPKLCRKRSPIPKHT